MHVDHVATVNSGDRLSSNLRDPRNPRIDAVGKMLDGLGQARYAAMSTLSKAERWTRYNAAHSAILGVPLPDAEFEDPSLWWTKQ